MDVSDERPASDELFERVLDFALYAPVGFALTVRDELPGKVKQGRQAMENRVQLARFIGQLAVQTGRKELARRLEERRAASAPDAPGASTAAESGMSESPQQGAAQEQVDVVTAGHEAPAEAAVPTAHDEVPSADGLPIADYENLAAIHVVDRLRSMLPDELELVRRFETAHRRRRTILAKIDQLQQR